MKNYQVLGNELLEFNILEQFVQETIAEYIACPNRDECEYDGNNNECCVKCKIDWLNSEFEN